MLAVKACAEQPDFKINFPDPKISDGFPEVWKRYNVLIFCIKHLKPNKDLAQICGMMVFNFDGLLLIIILFLL